MLTAIGLLGCGTPDGEGVAAEYRLTLDEEAVFEVLARSEIPAGEADRVELGLVVDFEDGPPGPFTVHLGGDAGEARWDVDPVEGEVLRYPADLDLLPCDTPCSREVVYTLEPGEPGRELFVAFELLAFGTRRSFDAWEHLDLGVRAPPGAR